MSSFIEYARAYLLGGSEEFLAHNTNTLEKRGLMRIEKRYDQCSYNTYCPSGSHCISATMCKRNVSYAWTAVFGVIFLLCLIGICLRHRRASAALVSQPAVVNTENAPQPQFYAPPAGDPNYAYQQQQPNSYPPTGYAAPAPLYSPPASSPYGEKPLEAPPAAYSPYPAPAGAPPVAEYSGAPYSTPHAPYAAPEPYAAPTSVPYPVPPGEASTYAPPPAK
ncbi:hypothetical protein BGX26_004392 [Mortierella sp. AD094]|nr:hypothetical protein BGX26_004392 [Mortierella sp. AD094]